ncbi:hypothetical protein CUC15_03600 [Oceanobacillus zhaokaii]|uniref:DUF3231 family protein n=1 Tax=Oceanobacillus zhaokaii TaxID=2052660 RepID=A0A345PDM6_9BACI|nr:DUF3231 family protein [Oceanobacillus zhaokaii]AXI08106.1 hypothetical protein CUC15_03600 [Oceanobacillus zhaokaii]
MGIMDGNPKNEPMHYGEVIGTWSFVQANNGLISMYGAFVNHAGDQDLIGLLEEAINKMQSENQEIEKLLKDNGVVPPPSLPGRPQANLEEIPAGARFMDPEISAILSVNVGQGLVSCSAVMGQCLREDIAMMFGKYHTEKALFGAKLLRLNKEKGWIIPPPLQVENS